MDKLFTFPITLSLEDKNCLIFGFGKVGQRKFAALKVTGAASITILDVGLPAEEVMEDVETHGNIKNIIYNNRSWQDKDLEDKFLVFACSSDKEKNDALCATCKEKSILCNNASNPEYGDFIMPAVARCGPLYAALGTGGASPLLAARMKRGVKEILEDNANLAIFLSEFRKIILNKNLPSNMNKDIFESILASELPEMLHYRQFDLCREWLIENVPVLNRADRNKIFNELKNDFTC